MSDYYEPKFIGGPKDGGLVPIALWVLDEVQLVQHLDDGRNMIYYYKLDDKSKDYIYQGQVEENEE